MKSRSPLVGAYHRPPASAILAHLPAEAELTLKREPFNEFDSKAVAVWVRISQVPEGQYASFEAALAGHGHALAEVLATSEWQLGYIAAKAPRGVVESMLYYYSRHVADQLDAVPAPGHKATLAFDAGGKPMVEIEWSAQHD